MGGWASKSPKMAICGKVDHGRPRQSQVQPGKARYSDVKDPPCDIFLKSRLFEDIKYDTDHLGTTTCTTSSCTPSTPAGCLGGVYCLGLHPKKHFFSDLFPKKEIMPCEHRKYSAGVSCG